MSGLEIVKKAVQVSVGGQMGPLKNTIIQKQEGKNEEDLLDIW